MSRIGNMPVPLPEGVKAVIEASRVTIRGLKGSSAMPLPESITIEQRDNDLVVALSNDSNQSRALQGTVRSRLAGMVQGLSEGISKVLEITGVGYRASLKGKNLFLQLGYSHDILFPIPEGITIQCPQPTRIEIRGSDKQLVGQVAAKIRSYRKPEPYKGKGVRYEGEYILRKEGKKK